MVEWRTHPRLEFGIRVINEKTNEIGVMKDLSVGGCFIYMSEKFSLIPIHEIVPIRFEIPGRDEWDDIYIHTEGRVTHHGKDGEGMGIDFVMLDSSVAHAINNFVMAYL